MWISSAFPSGALLVHGTDRTSEIQRATRALNTAGIAVYPVDTRVVIRDSSSGTLGSVFVPSAALRPAR